MPRNDPLTKEIAQRLAKAMWERGISGVELAAKIEKEEPKRLGKAIRITEWRSGKVMPRIQNAVELAVALGISLDWLLLGIGPMVPGEKSDAERAMQKIAEIAEEWLSKSAEASDERRAVEVHDLAQKAVGDSQQEEA